MQLGVRSRSLRNKIIAWSFVPTAIVLVTVALVAFYTYHRVTESLVIKRDRELTRLSASLLATELKAYTDPFTDQFPAVFDGGVVLFNTYGTLMPAEPDLPRGWEPGWLEAISFRQILSSSEPVFSDIMSGGPRGEKAIVVVVPISGRDGESVGGVAGLFRLGSEGDSVLYSSIDKLRREESNCVYLVDGNGVAIYHSNPDHIGEDFSAQAVVRRVLNGEVDALRTRDFDGRDIVASFAPVPGTSWGLVTEESWAALTTLSRRYGQFLLLLLALGVVAPVLIVTVGVRRITQPIAKLIRAAQQMAAGNFGQRIAASTGDEIEELAQQFNHMAAQLEESYAHLERKVAHRTKELATLNAIAAVVSRSLDLEEILNDALDEALDVMGMDRGQAFCLDEETQNLIPMAHRGLPDTARLPLAADAAGQAARVGHPIVKEVADYPEGEVRDLPDEREGSQLMISVPLMAKGRAVGAIDLGTHTPRSVAPEELSLLGAIGHQIGVAVENARLYEQAQQLAVVKERNRLARDLHDSVTQALYGVTLYAEAAARQLSLGEAGMASDHLREIRATAQEALREMRLLIFELRSPMLRQEGLAAALQARLEAVEGRLGLKTEFRGEGDGHLSPEVEEGLYRVAQEALNNALKHAYASSVTVYLHQDERVVTLEIADDGTGFDPIAARQRGGFGLRGMEERAARLGGKLRVQSSPGKGTRVRVEVYR
jgi:signal transduction histidine kinase